MVKVILLHSSNGVQSTKLSSGGGQSHLFELDEDHFTCKKLLSETMESIV